MGSTSAARRRSTRSSPNSPMPGSPCSSSVGSALEVLAMSDRILVIAEGRIVADVLRRGGAGAGDGCRDRKSGVCCRCRRGDLATDPAMPGARLSRDRAAAARQRRARLPGHSLSGLFLFSGRFLTAQNLSVIASNAAILAIVACAQALVLLTRNLDVSVGFDQGRCRLSSRPTSPRVIRGSGLEIVPPSPCSSASCSASSTASSSPMAKSRR